MVIARFIYNNIFVSGYDLGWRVGIFLCINIRANIGERNDKNIPPSC